MGIATGKVFCGPVGDHSRCEMSWIGDSVNHSARLMGMSMKTNSIYADKASVDAAASEVVFENIGQIALKGKGLVQSYQVNGLKYKGSVLTDQSSETTDMSAPPQMFDNLAGVHSALLLDWAVHSATNRHPAGLNNLKKQNDANQKSPKSRKIIISSNDDAESNSNNGGADLFKAGRLAVNLKKFRRNAQRKAEKNKGLNSTSPLNSGENSPNMPTKSIAPLNPSSDILPGSVPDTGTPKNGESKNPEESSPMMSPIQAIIKEEHSFIKSPPSQPIPESSANAATLDNTTISPFDERSQNRITEDGQSPPISLSPSPMNSPINSPRGSIIKATMGVSGRKMAVSSRHVASSRELNKSLKRIQNVDPSTTPINKSVSSVKIRSAIVDTTQIEPAAATETALVESGPRILGNAKVSPRVHESTRKKSITTTPQNILTLIAPPPRAPPPPLNPLDDRLRDLLLVVRL